MRDFMKIGPFETGDGFTNVYVSVGDAGIESTFSKSDEAGVKELLLRSKEPASCERALEAVARTLQLPVADPSEDALAFKAAIAVVLDHGPTLDHKNLELMIELIDALADFSDAESWHAFDADEPLRVELKNPTRTYEGCVMGQGGEVFGLALYHHAGSVRRIQQADHDAVLRLPATSVWAEHDASFALDAVEAFTGLPMTPRLVRMGDHKVEPLNETDVAALVATLKAVTAMAEGNAGNGTAVTSRHRTTALVSRQAGSEQTSVRGADRFANVGRNEPCPCGSGLKFKKCHLGSPAAAPASGSTKSPLHDDETKLLHALFAFSADSLKKDFLTLRNECLATCPLPAGLDVPIIAYEWLIEGKTLAALYLAAHPVLPAADRLWLTAQGECHLSVWEVLRVHADSQIELIDLLGGERRTVYDVSAAKGLVARDVVLARVFERPEQSLFVGVHPSVLEPRDGDELVTRARRGLPAPGWPRTAHLLALWNDCVRERDARAAAPMRLRNADGHDIVLLEDEFGVKKGSFPTVLSRLSGLEGASLDTQDARGANISFVVPDETVMGTTTRRIIGSVRLTKSKLVLSVNSVERAALLRERITHVLAEFVSYRGQTTHQLPVRLGGGEATLDTQVAPTMGLSDLHRSWLDSKVPALNEKTPRDAVADPSLRPQVHVLLKEMENHEARHGRLPGAPGADQLRRELGLDALGARVPHFELHQATGFGRKISETLLDFAEPLFRDVNPTAPESEHTLRFATLVWNIVVAEERKWKRSEVTRLRSSIAPGAFPLEIMRMYEALVARKRERFAGDLRMVGKWHFTHSGKGAGLFMEALLDPELIGRARAAGIVPSGS